MINIIIEIGVILLGSYFIIRSIYALKHQYIIVDGEEKTGKEAKKFSIFFIFLGSAAIIISLLLMISGHY